jgi:menaquinone-dependent protoporphyrinogen IX oxidase
VAADQAGRLNPTKPMHIHALNPKLQQLCTGVGLIERNTYYSLRRTAIIEVRRKHGTEQAKDIAFHVASANSLFFYDNVSFGDVDMQQFRLGGPESMSREEVQKYFSQANLARWQPAEDDELTFKEALEQAVKEQLPIQDGYITQELELKQLYDEVSNKLGELQMTGDIPDTEKIPTGHSAKDGATYKALSYQYELHDLTKKIEEQLATRKKVFRSIRLQLRKSITQDLRKKHRAVLAESQKQARRKLSTGGSYEPQPVRDVQVTGLRQFTVEAALLDEDPEADFSSEDDVEGVDEEVLEQQNITSREEPECWGE